MRNGTDKAFAGGFHPWADSESYALAIATGFSASLSDQIYPPHSPFPIPHSLMLTKATVKPPRWQRSNYSPLKRQVDVFSAAAKLACDLWWDRIMALDSPNRRNSRAQWLVQKLLDLGPTFIKIGQSLSTRADLIPLEYVQALSQLQDRVPPFSGQDAIAVIESELGNSVYALYRDFNPQPLASASLGQVHKARLHTGEDVVVKVQRPGIEKLFNLDFEVLHRLVRFGNRYFPGFKKYEMEGIYQEFFEILYQEIDYIHEGKNAERFRENFNKYPRICVPQVYWKYTTRKVLTLEYLPGIKIDDRESLETCGINTNELIQLGICCYLKQLLEDGFFQSDPHPGNMAVTQDGRIIFYDFGTMAEVKAIAKDQMIKTFFAVIRKDTDEVVNTLTYMGLIDPMSDMKPVKRLIAFILDKFRDKPIDIKEFEKLGSEIYLMFEQQPFRLPPQMTFILKSLTTLDGIARALNPEYNLLAASQPFVKSLSIDKGQGKVIRELARQAGEFLKQKWQQPSNTEIVLRRLESRIEGGELEIRVRSLSNDRTLKGIHLAIKSLIYACLTGFTLLAGTILLLVPQIQWAIVAFSCSGFWFFILLYSLIQLGVKERLDKLIDK